MRLDTNLILPHPTTRQRMPPIARRGHRFLGSQSEGGYLQNPPGQVARQPIHRSLLPRLNELSETATNIGTSYLGPLYGREDDVRRMLVGPTRAATNVGVAFLERRATASRSRCRIAFLEPLV